MLWGLFHFGAGWGLSWPPVAAIDAVLRKAEEHRRRVDGRMWSSDFQKFAEILATSYYASCLSKTIKHTGQANYQGAGMLHLRELQILCCVFVVERDREVVGKLAHC